MHYRFVLFWLLLLLTSTPYWRDRENTKLDLFKKDSDSWLKDGAADWYFEGDTLVGVVHGGSGHVMTKSTYSDFELTLEFKPDETVNSGVFIRCNKQELSNIECYEINIWDNHPDQKSRTGAIVTRAEPVAKIHTIGTWNSYRIWCKGYRIRVWINNILTADIENRDLHSGYVGLQAAEEGVIKFRNVQLRLLE